MKKWFGQSFILFAFIGLSAAMVLSAWSFVNSDQKWRQTYILLGQTGEIQSRAHKLQEKLTRATAYIELASRTGEVNPRLQTTMVGLKTNIQELLSAEYLDDFLSQREIDLLTKHQQIVQDKYLSSDSHGVSYFAMLEQLEPVKENISRILSDITAKARILGETAQMESKTAQYRSLFTMGAVLFLFAAIAFYIAFFLLNGRKNISDPSLLSMPTLPPAG